LPSSAKRTGATAATCRILHVNDSDADHQLLAEVLQANGSFSLARARSGVEALQLLRHKVQLPNLVVISWSFALITCAEFIDQMKSEKRFAVIPIVVLASRMTPDEVAVAYDTGAACVLQKGPDRESLARSLEALASFWDLVLLPFCESPARPASTTEKTAGKTPQPRKLSKVTPRERRAIAKKAVEARWAKAKNHRDAPSHNEA
jgi:CheY-like chemotaxis protein